MKRTNGAVLVAFALVIALAAGLIIGSRNQFLSATGMDKKESVPQNQNSQVVVIGNGKINVKPDIAILRLGVETLDMDCAKSQKDNANTMAKVIQAVKNAGIKEEQIQTTSYNIMKKYNYSGSSEKFEGYMVSNGVSIVVKDIEKAGEIFDIAIKAGANTAEGIEFNISDRNVKYKECLKLAMQDAKDKASVIMAAIGKTPGTPFVVREFSAYGNSTLYRGNGMNYEMAKGSADTGIEAGQLSVECNLEVIYQY